MREYAKIIANKYGCNHKEYEVFPELEKIISKIIYAFDEPFADPSTIPSYYLCENTRETVKVALSGLGGDELFGGYERYLGMKMSIVYDAFPIHFQDKLFKALIEKIPERKDGHYTVNHIKRFFRGVADAPKERYYKFISIMQGTDLFKNERAVRDSIEYCKASVMKYFKKKNATDPLDKVFYCDIKTYLPEDILALTDRVSMLNSLEVRVPFLDHKLVECCAKIPNSFKIKRLRKKHIFRKAVKNYLPKEIFELRKQGFTAPMTSWIRNDLKEFVIKNTIGVDSESHNLFNKNFVHKIVDDHLLGKQINDKLIWSILIFNKWHQKYMI